MLIGETIGISLLILVFLLFLYPVIESRRLFFKKNEPKPTLPKGKRNNDAVARWYLEQCLKAAKKDFLIVSGGLYPKVYNEKLAGEFKTALKNRPKLKVKILVGPEILCEKDTSENSFWKKYQDGEFGDRVEIRILPTYPEEHFRVVDKKGLLLENGHPWNGSERIFHFNLHSFSNAPVYASEFEKAWNRVDINRKPILKAC
jgi:hypothetical protein